jgi:alpha-glucoside transport system substrate-binding protein
MAARTWRRGSTAVAGALGVSLALMAFAGSSSGAFAAVGPAAVDCTPFASYGTYPAGTTVTIKSSITGTSAQAFLDSFADFTTCTGAAITWDGTNTFEADLQAQVTAGTAPDLAAIPQPGLVKTLVASGAIKAPSAAVTAQATAAFTKDWLTYGTVNGTLYAPPLGANVKSFVWYSPSMFAAKGWTVPTTWADMLKLSDTIAASGIKPWCAGIESGGATGWVATDWLEDVLLRTAGPAVYDQWVAHTVPFSDARVVAAIDQVGAILKNSAYVNGGLGDVASIATTSFSVAGNPILTGQCALHRQASFYGWPAGTTVGPTGNVYAFYLPAVDPAAGKPVLGGGEFLAAFNTKPVTQAVQLYMNSSEWVNKKAALGDWITANKNLLTANVLTGGVANPINQLSVQFLQDPAAVFRFDGSDQMPSAVGAGTFWTQMTAWINGQTTAATVAAIDASWPAS